MQVVSFMNMKGGVGKTTLAVNVAYALAHQHGKQVLIVDCDPQFNTSQYLVAGTAYLSHVNDPKKGMLRDVFMPKRAGPISTMSGGAKAINKSRMSLAECTIEIFSGSRGKPGRLDLLPNHLSIIDIEYSRRQTELKLKNYLNEKASHYDYVIIDCPPTISFFTQAAMLASHKYIVPIKPDPLSVVGLPLLEHHIDGFTSDIGMDIEQIGIVLTMVTGFIPHMMRAVIDDLRKTRKNAVFKDYLSHSTGIASSVAAHEPIFLHKKASQKTKMQILDITAEFLTRTGG